MPVFASNSQKVYRLMKNHSLPNPEKCAMMTEMTKFKEA